MIAIIDYDAGNLRSVEKALDALGEQPVISRDEKTILSADRVILPGVGSFGDAMGKLRQYGLVDVIHRVTDQGTPFLGICLGLQLLFERSGESEGVPGLGSRFPTWAGTVWTSVRKQSFLKDWLRGNMCILSIHII